MFEKKLSQIKTNSDDKGDDNDNYHDIENQQVKQGETELLNAITSKLVFHMVPTGHVSTLATNIFQVQNLIWNKFVSGYRFKK